MDWKELDIMLEKYYEGATTLEEERAIKQFFESANLIPAKYEESAALFIYLKMDAQVKMPVAKKNSLSNKNRSLAIISSLAVAAALALLISLSGIFQPKMAIDQIAEITYEEQKKAYHQTKEALLIVSENLNRGKKEIQRLSIFHEVQKTIIKN